MKKQQTKLIDLLDNHRLDDSYFKDAYQESSALFRSKVKTALAFHESYYGFGANCVEQSIDYDLFKITSRKTKVLHLFVAIDSSFINPAQLIAALMPAILAKVENIYLIFLDFAPNSLLTCLELMGIENVYLFNDAKDLANFDIDLFLNEKAENLHKIQYNWTNLGKENIICSELSAPVELAYIFKDLNLDFYQKTQVELKYLI